MTPDALGRTSLFLTAAVFAALPAAASAQGPGEAIRNGLMATYSDGAGRKFIRIENEPAFSLKANESPHPHLAADSFAVTYQGYMDLLRRGSYRFSVRAAGSVKFSVNHKPVLEGTAAGEPKTFASEPIELTPGPLSLKIEFTRAAGPAVLQVFWEAKQFQREPLPATALRTQARAATAELEAGLAADHGRFLIEEFACTSCHKAGPTDKGAAALKPRVAAELNRVGEVTNANWVYHWLGNPQAYRPGTVMPQAFSDDEAGRVERAALAKYLVSLSKAPTAKPALPNPKESAAAAGRGHALFETVGCAVCHSAPADKQAHAVLKGVGSKFDSPALARFLANPGGHNPHTRMPNLLLQPKETGDLVAHLSRDVMPAFEQPLPEPSRQAVAAAHQRVAPDDNPAVFARLSAEQQVNALGRKLVEARNCLGCHTLKDGGKAVPPPVAPAFAVVAKSATAPDRRGCLNPTAPGKAPKFTVSDQQRGAIRAFAAHGSGGAGAPAPTFAANVALTRLNCVSCHQRNGGGGLTLENLETLRKYEKVENAEAVMPPPLTGVGYKLKLPWLREVLLSQKRIRPWMALRMPQFANVHLEGLAEGLTACDGIRPEDDEPQQKFNPEYVTQGRKLVGKAGFSCVSCHDVAGHISSGTRGPDMATIPQRIRQEWYQRWMWEPQRIAPGTRMPTVHVDGVSGQREILAGQLEPQLAAMWQYLSLGANLPLPDGLEPPKGLTLGVRERPVVERTFLPDAGGRGIAVGFPGGVSLGFDANNCRLSYGWTGGFLDMTPVWAGRGGNPAKPMGPKFWSAPAGFPWHFADSAATQPNWAAYAKDPAYNRPSWDADMVGGVRRVHFEGYSTKDVPTFRYRLEPAEGGVVSFVERLEPLQGAASVGVGRSFEVTAPAGRVGRLLLGETTTMPRIMEDGVEMKLDAAADVIEQPAAGRPLVLTAGERVTVLAPRNVPAGSAWVITKVGTARQVALRLPAAVGNAAMAVRIDILTPYRNDPALIEQTIKAAGK